MAKAERDLEVIDNQEASRYELFDGEQRLGFADYKFVPGRILFTYIEVDPVLQGHGLGSILTEAALEDCRDRGLQVTASCPFIIDYLRDHPEYDDIAPRA